MNKLQTPKEISDLLQVSQSTVLRMAYGGDLPYIALRSGKRKKIIRFDPLEVEKWLKKRAPLKAEKFLSAGAETRRGNESINGS